LRLLGVAALADQVVEDGGATGKLEQGRVPRLDLYVTKELREQSRSEFGVEGQRPIRQSAGELRRIVATWSGHRDAPTCTQQAVCLAERPARVAQMVEDVEQRHRVEKSLLGRGAP
jgi:hypothetical protein